MGSSVKTELYIYLFIGEFYAKFQIGYRCLWWGTGMYVVQMGFLCLHTYICIHTIPQLRYPREALQSSLISLGPFGQYNT